MIFDNWTQIFNNPTLTMKRLNKMVFIQAGPELNLLGLYQGLKV